MSRIGKKPIPLSKDVTVIIENGIVSARGPKGSSRLVLHPRISAAKDDRNLKITVDDAADKNGRALWGLYRALAANLVQGVTHGFEKKLELVGVGYKAAVQGQKLIVEAGYSHPVETAIPEGISVKVEKNTIAIGGIDRQAVGQFAALIRSIRKPEPYKGKGIKYADEVIRRKAGKAAKAAGAA